MNEPQTPMTWDELSVENERLRKERNWWRNIMREELRMRYFSEKRVEQEFKKLKKAMRKELGE